jgi:hypothetical protein
VLSHAQVRVAPTTTRPARNVFDGRENLRSTDNVIRVPADPASQFGINVMAQSHAKHSWNHRKEPGGLPVEILRAFQYFISENTASKK